MFVQVYGGVVALLLASVLVGRAICTGGFDDQRAWAAPAVGLAALIIIESIAIKLPGRAVTAAIVGAVAAVVALAFLIWRRRLRFYWDELVIAGVALIGASLPFLASGRIGLIGVGLDNDTSNHLLWAEALRSRLMDFLWPPPSGYPLGPHSLADAVASGGGVRLDLAFTAMIVAVVPITAIVAAGVVADEAPWRRIVVGITCAFAYLFAAYYGEASFKETILASLLLAFVVLLDQVTPRWSQARTVARVWLIVPAVVLVAGALYSYSYVGLVWFALSGVIWVVAEAARRPTTVIDRLSRVRVASAAPWFIGAVVLLLIVALPVAGQAVSFFRQVGISPAQNGAIPSTAYGNLIHPLSAYESLGIWLSSDFRQFPANTFHTGQLSAFALLILAYGVVWSWQRRSLLLPAAVAACMLIWWRSDRTQAPYVTAKSLAIAAPVIMALGTRALLSRRPGGRPAQALALAAAAAFCGLGLYSSWLLLRDEPVQAPEAGRELAAFHRTIGASTVLFLGEDDFAPWQLRPAEVTSLNGGPSLGQAVARPNKPAPPGQPADFDSVDPTELDRFQYVITTNTPYASQAPPNFRLIDQSKLYQLWDRTGPTTARQVLEPSGAPGAILNCGTVAGRELSREHGEASIMATPETFPGIGLSAGGVGFLALRLPAGRWEISIQYSSSFTVDLSTDGAQWTMPAYLGRQGPFFAVGAVTGRGAGNPVILQVGAKRPSFLTGGDKLLYTSISAIAATRVPDTRVVVPLKQACGKYVDWYRVS